MLSNVKIKAILFDLGGVLVHLDGPPIKNEWLSTPITAEKSWARWYESSYVTTFEKGQIGVNEFSKGIVQEQGLIISPEKFVFGHRLWPSGLFPNTLELLENLRREYTLALYSNTNELHWPRLMDEMQLEGKFDHYFASFQMNMYKPDVEPFRFVAKEMSLAPEQIFFLDDNAHNVASALEAGMQSQQAKGLEQVRWAIENKGLMCF